jgi:uncharacterized protein involved in exopolysaccharide biosynthesis
MISTNNLDNNKFFEDEISMIEILQKIKLKFKKLIKFKTPIISIILFSLILGYIYHYNIPLKYKAEINFVLDDEKSGAASGAGIVASQLGIDIGGGSNGIFSGENLIYLFKSKRILDKTLISRNRIDGKEISIADYYLQTFYPQKYKKDIFNTTKINELSKDQTIIIRSIRSEILKNILKVSQIDKKLSITTIEVISKNEFFSKIFCEQIANDVSNFYIETKSKKAKINKDILQKQVDSIKNELNKSIEGVAIENDKVYNFNPAYMIRRTPSSKKNIEIQANAAILNQLVPNLEMAKISLRKETPLIQIIDYPILPLDRIKYPLTIIEFIFGFIALLVSSLYYLFIKK